MRRSRLNVEPLGGQNMTRPRLLKAIDVAIAIVGDSPDLAELPFEVRIVAIVHAAQGIIDNGGLQYFFEVDFPNKPGYSMFVDAYRVIGAIDAALALEQAVSLFPFEEPHLHVQDRNWFMDSFKNEDGDEVNSPFTPLTNVLCGNERVWGCLEAFVNKHAAAFGLA
jgi:hypothetical protein